MCLEYFLPATIAFDSAEAALLAIFSYRPIDCSDALMAELDQMLSCHTRRAIVVKLDAVYLRNIQVTVDDHEWNAFIMKMHQVFGWVTQRKGHEYEAIDLLGAQRFNRANLTLHVVAASQENVIALLP